MRSFTQYAEQRDLKEGWFDRAKQLGTIGLGAMKGGAQLVGNTVGGALGQWTGGTGLTGGAASGAKSIGQGFKVGSVQGGGPAVKLKDATNALNALVKSVQGDPNLSAKVQQIVQQLGGLGGDINTMHQNMLAQAKGGQQPAAPQQPQQPPQQPVQPVQPATNP